MVDFAFFTRNYDLILLVEIGDSSHKKRERVIRDIYVKKICNEANIRLIFYNPSKFVNKFEAQDKLRNEIIAYYDNNENIIYE